MAFVVTFSNHRGEPAQRGPFDSLRFDGNELRDRRSGPIIATHGQHRWHLGGELLPFSRLQCDGPLFVYFIDRAGRESRCFGSFQNFSCIDGVAFVGTRIAAFCDQEQSDWYSYDLGGHWTAMIVTTEPPSAPLLPDAPAAFPGA